MSVDIQIVKRVARLARIAVTVVFEESATAEIMTEIRTAIDKYNPRKQGQ